MKANLFKNFKTLKEKEGEKKLAEDENLDNVSVIESEQAEPTLKESKINPEEESSVVEKTDSGDIVKKRPVKKEILEAKAALMSNNTDSSGGYSKSIKKDQGKRTFTVFMKAASLEFLKDLVFYKATAERQIFYSQSEAVIEALELIMPSYKSINTRPDFIREQEKAKKGGRKRNSDEIYEATTTIYIPGQYYDFIKDVTYNKVIAGDLYFKDWDLLEESFLKLKKKYGKNIQPRPDYIREDEKQRGRRSKADS
ncbi:hypothetical protein [Chryseobacterium sp. M5A1_1a]